MAYAAAYNRIVDIAQHPDEYRDQRKFTREIRQAINDAGFSIFGYDLAFGTIKEGIELDRRLISVLERVNTHNKRVIAPSMRVPTEGLEYAIFRVEFDLDDNMFGGMLFDNDGNTHILQYH